MSHSLRNHFVFPICAEAYSCTHRPTETYNYSMNQQTKFKRCYLKGSAAKTNMYMVYVLEIWWVWTHTLPEQIGMMQQDLFSSTCRNCVLIDISLWKVHSINPNYIMKPFRCLNSEITSRLHTRICVLWKWKEHSPIIKNIHFFLQATMFASTCRQQNHSPWQIGKIGGTQITSVENFQTMGDALVCVYPML